MKKVMEANYGILLFSFPSPFLTYLQKYLAAYLGIILQQQEAGTP